MQQIKTDLEALLVQLNLQIDEVCSAADAMGTLPEKMRTPDGAYLLAPLLVAKAQVACALYDLQRTRTVVNVMNPPGRTW